MGKRNKVTTRDIAEYTGVSQSTVSMILSNKPHVSFSKETIDKVRQGAKELGYKKPVAGVKKKEQALAKSIITERAKDYGYTVFTVSTLRDVSQEELYLNLLSGFELAGVISLYPPTKIAQANALSKQVPVVSIGDKPDACRFDAVELDSKKPGYIIAEHLSLGHKHITYICTPIRPKEIGRIHRLAGLRSCFKDHGLDPEWVEVKSPTIAAYGRYSADNSEYQNGYDMASQALDEHTSSTAFVGNNDMTAFGIMAAISDHGFRVPHDYSVCGFDNIPLSSMPQIALTTIEHASLAKGREAVDIIYKKNTQKNISAKHHYALIFIHSVRYHITMINVYESQIRRAHGQQTSK